MTSNRHPLIGKLIRINHADYDMHCVSRFTVDLGQGLMLATRLSPHNGKDSEASHIIVLGLVAQDDRTEVFDDWDKYCRETYGPYETRRVLKLVPKAPSE